MIYIGADHNGFSFKEKIKHWLTEWEYDYEDLGAFELDLNDNYPDFAKLVAESVSSEDLAKGIVICGSGVGVDIVVNRFQGIRCGLAIDADQIKSARQDDDINVLALAADETSEEDAQLIVKTFLETEFSGEEKYKRRIEEIDD